MKKYLLLTLFLLSFQLSFSQTINRYHNSWRFGLNIGGMWQTADVRSTAGVAGGFTLEKGIFENSTHFFSLAIRGRGLFGNTYGLDSKRNYDIKNNPALNGNYNAAVKYDSTGALPYVYNNYRTQINEGALELQISFNKLREKTNVLLNLWGGVGLTSYRTNTNLLDADGKIYNYAKVDSSGTKSSILSSHKNLLDGSYESYGNGSKRNNLITFSPSAGIGLGYKVGNGFSILFEYKVTFPQGVNADYLDGIVGPNTYFIAKSNDYYHYAGLNLLFTLGRGKTKKTTSTTNNSNVNPVNTNTQVVIPPTNTIGINPVTPVNPVVPVEKKPVVNFVNPANSPYNEKRDVNFNISANAYNVGNRNQINVSFNGNPVNNFAFNGNNIAFPVSLVIGNNNVTISANNQAGSDSKTAIINYSGNPPLINYTSPSSNPYSTSVSVVGVNATISNVVSNYDVTVKLNGSPLNNYNYTVGSGLFNTQLNLNPGTNELIINATNPFGSDNKKLIINYIQPINTTTTVANAGRPVKVIITNPVTVNYKTNNSFHQVKANVSNVSSAAQVTVSLNGATIPFNYVNGAIDFPANLNEGNNTVVVSASNATSSDSKSANILYEVIKKSPPPSVTITNPQPSPFTTTKSDYIFKANTYFVSNTNEIEVKLNGNLISNYVFNSTNGTIEYQSGLLPNSDNLFEVKVSNAYGSKLASGIVKQQGMANTEIEIKTIEICHRIDKLRIETITIFENEWASHQAHGDVLGKCKVETGNDAGGFDKEIAICHNTTGIPQTIIIKESEWPSHLAHGDKKGPCPKSVENPVNPELDKDVVICHNDGNGGKQTITIKQSQLSIHQAHGDEIGVCPRVVQIELEPEQTITICHIPPGNSGNPQTITIPMSAWPAHQAHGDSKGACPVVTPTVSTGGGTGNNNPDPNKKITICHIPPGNNSNPQTIEIPESAWPAHQAHGDTKGACVSQKTAQPVDNDDKGKSGDGEIKQIKKVGNDGISPGRPMQADTTKKNEIINIGRPR